MSETVQGFLTKLNTKTGQGKRGPWTLYSGRIELPNGNEYPEWVTFGFEDLGIKEGDYLEFQIEKTDRGYFQVVKDSLSKPKNPPARARPAKSGQASNTGVSAENTAGDTGANRQTQIVMQHSQDMAIRVVEVLLENKALPISGTQAKAGEAKRFEEIMAAVDKLTVQFYNDVVTARLLDVVADAGAARVSTKADGSIPEAGDDDPSEGAAYDA